MDHEERTETDAPDDERAAGQPAEQGDPEPTPGEDGGPQGNPAQDEEALRHSQEESAEG
jgi:hypothetical protein